MKNLIALALVAFTALPASAYVLDLTGGTTTYRAQDSGAHSWTSDNAHGVWTDGTYNVELLSEYQWDWGHAWGGATMRYQHSAQVQETTNMVLSRVDGAAFDMSVTAGSVYSGGSKPCLRTAGAGTASLKVWGGENCGDRVDSLYHGSNYEWMISPIFAEPRRLDDTTSSVAAVPVSSSGLFLFTALGLMGWYTKRRSA